MKKFTLSDEGFESIKRKTMQRGMLTGVVTSLIAAVVFAFFQQGANPIWTIIVFLVVFGLFFAVALFGARRSVNRLQEFWESYDLRLSEDKLTLKHSNTEKVTLQRAEVARIGETPGEGLWVSTGTEDDDVTIHIPKELRFYDEARRKLADWQPVEEIPSQGSRVPGWAWIAVLALAYALILLVDIVWIVVPVGAVLLGVGGFVIAAIVRSPNLEPSIKLGSVLIGLMMLSVLFRVGFVLAQTFGVL